MKYLVESSEMNYNGGLIKQSCVVLTPCPFQCSPNMSCREHCWTQVCSPRQDPYVVIDKKFL